MVYISFVIPFYGVEKFIGQCLESIYSQQVSEEEYEVICIDDGSTDDAHLGALLDIFLGEENSFFDFPKTNAEVVGTLAVAGAGGVVGTEDGLSAGAYFGRYFVHELGLGEDGLVVYLFECLHRRRVEAHTATHVCSRADGEHIGAVFLYFLAYALLGTLADGHHDDDRSHTDNDTEHGEEGATFVTKDGFDCDFDKVGEGHCLMILMVEEDSRKYARHTTEDTTYGGRRRVG